MRWRVWLASTTLNNTGDGASQVGFQYLAAIATGARGISTVVGANVVGLLLASPVAGLLGDRWNRRNLLIRANVLRGLLVLLAGVLVISDDYTIVALAVIYFVLGACEALVDGVAEAVVPALVADVDLDRAFARQYGAEGLGNTIVGPPLGSLLLKIDRAGTLIFDAVTYFAVSAALLSLPKSFGTPEPTGDRPGLLRELSAGFVFLVRSKTVRANALGLAVANLGYATVAYYGFFVVEDRYGLNPSWLGVLMVGTAVGGLASDQVVSRTATRVSPPWMGVVGGLLALGGLGFVAITSHLVLGFVGMVFVGLGLFVTMSVCAAARQRVIPDDLKARVGAAYRAVVYLGLLGGTLGAGWFIREVGVQETLLLAALLSGLGCVIASAGIDSGRTADNAAG
jgi:predicted MFS family arabinose efflux permease